MIQRVLQRKCACGGSCANCQKRKRAVQRQAESQRAPVAVPPLVHEVLRSPGRPLEAMTRAFMEPRFGHDFAQVRVHADGRAAESARSVDALAYTVGRDIVFGRGQYRPGTIAGDRLIAHELVHAVQQQPVDAAGPLRVGDPADVSEHEADRAATDIMGWADVPVAVARAAQFGGVVQRQAAPGAPVPSGAPTSSSTPSTPMTRQQFETAMKGFGVYSIRKGTYEETPVQTLQRPLPQPDCNTWQSWDPGESSFVYTKIVDAFTKIQSLLGDVPPVQEITFFDSQYVDDNAGGLLAERTTGASFSAGKLTVFKAVTTGNTIATLQKPTPEQAVQQNITHELGHSLTELALPQPQLGREGIDPNLIVDYKKAVGWAKGAKPEEPEHLYDIQASGVSDAIEKGTPPPADAMITRDNWDKKPWRERPISWYMTTLPFEDFAEAFMAFVNIPDVLNALSPARFKFIDSHRVTWEKHLSNIWERTKRRGGPPKENVWERAKRGAAGPPQTKCNK